MVEFNGTLDELQDLISSNKKVVLDFHAEWCGPCKMVAPILEEIDQNNEDVTIVKIDIDVREDLKNIYGIMSVPTMYFFEEGVRHEIQTGVFCFFCCTKVL